MHGLFGGTPSLWQCCQLLENASFRCGHMENRKQKLQKPMALSLAEALDLLVPRFRAACGRKTLMGGCVSLPQKQEGIGEDHLEA